MTIGLVYATLLALGVAYAILTAAFGWMADHDFGGADADTGHAHPISGTVAATFVTGFGAGGTIAHHLLGWSLLPGLVAATIGGLALAGLAFAVLEFLFSRTQAGSEFEVDEAVGRTAEVITSIPAEGIGEVAYVVRGQRETAGARSVDGAAVAKGRQVTIEKMSGTTAYVRRSE